MSVKKIVITGGPSTGKTSVIQELEHRGYRCIPELVRGLTAAEKNANAEETMVTNPILSVKDPYAFNNKLLQGRIAQYRSAENTDGELVFFDRGIPDTHAYMACFGQSYDAAFERPAYDYRYHQILLMPPWRDIYNTDSERFESFEESERIFTALKNTYQDFGYAITLIPTGNVKERTDFILDLVKPA